MSAYNVIHITCEELESAVGYAQCGAALSEAETSPLEVLPTHCRFVDSINGVDIWYDYAADYYFFTEYAEGY